jgi:hypothetical protein
MTRHPRLRRFVTLAPRLLALLATSFFLIATQRYEPDINQPVQDCFHTDESVSYHVTGTCGPEGDIVVSSAANECAINVRGAGAVGLPSAGRFDESNDSSVSLSSSAWTLSGYLPEAALPDGSVAAQPDAGIFTVVRDAGADVGGGFTVTPGAGGQAGTVGQHPAPVVRTCTYRQNKPNPPSLLCSGGALATCEAVLGRL